MKQCSTVLSHLHSILQASLSNISKVGDSSVALPLPLQLPLLHPSQHPQRHVKLLASAPAVLEVAEAATSLLADVGVIEPAVSTGTAVPTLVQLAHDQVSGKIRLLSYS